MTRLTGQPRLPDPAAAGERRADPNLVLSSPASCLYPPRKRVAEVEANVEKLSDTAPPPREKK